MSYTVLSIAAVVATLAVDLVALRTRLVTRKVFWVAYAIVLVFQLLVNGVLTGHRVVRYDPHTVLGPRIAYAPVEDLLFGFALVTLTLALWIRLGPRHQQCSSPSRRTRSRGRAAAPASTRARPDRADGTTRAG